METITEIQETAMAIPVMVVMDMTIGNGGNSSDGYMNPYDYFFGNNY